MLERHVMRAADKSAMKSGEAGRPGFDEKVRFLSDPANYPERPPRVTLRETHHAWLFMTDRHVYKMKKPFRLGGFDFSSLESRHRLCKEEFRLNRRLAQDTYLGVVAMVLNERGELEVEADGCAVEWLVKMLRLADSQALLEAALQDRATPVEIRKLMRKLCRFYANAATINFAAGAYVTHLREKLEYWSRELLQSQSALPDAAFNDLLRQQLSYIDENSDLLEMRAREGDIREDAEPEIIDCLEFDADLRRLDSAEEIAFLAMECRHAGFELLARDCFNCYQIEFGRAAAPHHLWNFYASLGATVRAGLSAWRIPDLSDGEKWRRRASRYLDDALHYIKRAGESD
jgi:aminoglycoside phosphotransferase family enzyme